MARGEGTEVSAAGLLSSPGAGPNGDVPQKNQRTRLTVCRKICYAIGGAPYQITGSALGFFLQIYLLDVAQLDPFYASIILFFGRAWDAITDPTVGFMVSRSKWTRVGRMMPWVLLSTPFAVLTYILLWFVPPFESGKFIWCLIFYCLFQTMQTCFHVPYSALTMFITSDQKERDSATAYRMMVEVLGSLLGTAIQGQIVGGSTPCIVEDNMTASSNVSMVTLEDKRKDYLIASGVICIIYILCAAVLFLGIKETKERGQDKSKALPLKQGLFIVLSHGPYIRLVIGVLFTSLAFMLLEGNFAIFITYTLKHRDDFQNLLLVVMLSATLSVPLWQWFLTRYGKKTALNCSMILGIPFMIIIVTVRSNLIISYLISVAAGVSVGASFFLPWSMLPDVVDDFKVRNPDIHGHEALFYSFYVFFIKFASGISLGISTLSLKFAGYVTGSCTQPEEVNYTLRILVCPVPLCLIATGLLIIKTYPIDEKRRERNQKELQKFLESEENSESETTALGNTV